jgi:hypothetical protein
VEVVVDAKIVVAWNGKGTREASRLIEQAAAKAATTATLWMTNWSTAGASV